MFDDALAAGVMAAPHHGSKNAAHPGMALAVSPDTVLISAGVDNQYGHPDAKAVGALLARRGARVPDQHPDKGFRGSRGAWAVISRRKGSRDEGVGGWLDRDRGANVKNAWHAVLTAARGTRWEGALPAQTRITNQSEKETRKCTW